MGGREIWSREISLNKWIRKLQQLLIDAGDLLRTLLDSSSHCRQTWNSFYQETNWRQQWNLLTARVRSIQSQQLPNPFFEFIFLYFSKQNMFSLMFHVSAIITSCRRLLLHSIYIFFFVPWWCIELVSIACSTSSSSTFKWSFMLQNSTSLLLFLVARWAAVAADFNESSRKTASNNRPEQFSLSFAKFRQFFDFCKTLTLLNIESMGEDCVVGVRSCLKPNNEHLPPDLVHATLIGSLSLTFSFFYSLFFSPWLESLFVAIVNGRLVLLIRLVAAE